MTARYALRPVLLVVVATCSAAGCSRQPTSDAQNASPVPLLSAGPSPGEQAAGSMRLIADFTQRCAGQPAPSESCDILQSLVVAEVSTALDLMQRSRDQRSVPLALAALDLPGEPAIFVAASRVLGRFPTSPGIVDKVLPQLLENRYVQVQRFAATLLAATPNPGAAEAGRLWLRHHSSLTAVSPYEEYPDFPPHYAAIGVSTYPGAEWFSPADSDHSIGWSTTDDIAAVERWFSQALKVEAMTAQQWNQRQAEQAMRAIQSLVTSRAARMQPLMARMARGDQAAAAEVEKMQKEFDAADKDAAAVENRGVKNVATPPDALMTQGRWFIARQKSGRASVVVLLFPLPDLKRTVMQVVWDLADYPSAWPKLQG